MKIFSMKLLNMNYLKLSVLASACLLTACSTIVFDNGPQSAAMQAPITQSHHGGGFFELVEFSKPKNLKAICQGNDWGSVSTEMTFVDGLIRQVVPAGIYSPRTTYTRCAQGSALVTSGIEMSSATSKEQPAARISPQRVGGANTTSYNPAPAGGSSYEEDNEASDIKSKSVACDPKHKHLFFDCE